MSSSLLNVTCGSLCQVFVQIQDMTTVFLVVSHTNTHKDTKKALLIKSHALNWDACLKSQQAKLLYTVDVQYNMHASEGWWFGWLGVCLMLWYWLKYENSCITFDNDGSQTMKQVDFVNFFLVLP